MAAASELSQVNIADPRTPQLRAQDLLVELRVVSRAWDAAHIDDALDTVRSQKIKKGVPGMCGMSNG
ncbi:MAG TPA: hypothetical protein VKR57_00965 [Terriglobales bacterium]|nr:hypothetical protein [Terriglobales bacterium]